MQKGLVSILTPCYNAGHLIYRLLDSVLNQTYSDIEMFVIDDGSTDNSSNVVQNYIDKFKNRGYTLTYLYQENSGQSVAIKNGLSYINGEYLVWPDSDDFFYSNDAIRKMVNVLYDAPPEYAVVRCMQNVVNENTLDTLFVLGNNDHIAEAHNLFEDCLFVTNNFYWGAGAYMVKTEALAKTTNFDIYTEKKAGQNWQLFLPIFYSYKCLTIKEILYSVLSRNKSHSREGFGGYRNKIERIDVYERTVLATLSRIIGMTDEDRQAYINRVKQKFLCDKLRIAFLNKQRQDYINWYNLLPVGKKLYSKETLLYLLVCFHLETVFYWLRSIR